jgi:5-methylcytosine-specific restriction endonuclease McrA
MARPIKKDLNGFPIWNPQWGTIRKFESNDFKIRYKTLRNSSSNFIKKREVREIIAEKCNGMCNKCGCTFNLHIDHIKSVYLAAQGKFPIDQLNSYHNLTLLCRSCNSKKTPNEPT